jgi:transposase InsO family protein
MCRVLQVRPSGYYAWLERGPSRRAREADDSRLKRLIKDSHAQSGGRYGSPRVHEDLRAKGERVSRKRISRLMREEELRGAMRRRWVTTTLSEPSRPAAPNVLDRNFAANAPNQSWVGDVTALDVKGRWVYLATLIDLFSRRVVGWALGWNNDRHLALKALEMAIEHRRPERGLIHHTDRGSPYTSEQYQAALESHGIVCSMSNVGDCYDNAVAESWFATFKSECGERFQSYAHTWSSAFAYIEAFYNSRRRHSSLGYRTPLEVERSAA